MRPVLLEVMGWKFPAYGTTLVVIFFGGLLMVGRRTARLGITRQHIFDIAGLAAGVILVWTVASISLGKAGVLRTPSLKALPILTAGSFAILAYLRRQGLPAEKVFDEIAPVAAYALALLFGLGTLLAGTAFGKPTGLPWGIVFPPDSPAYRVNGDAPLHPTQLYLGGLFLLIGLASDRLGAKAEPGQRALWTFSAIAAAYLLVSPLRDNTMSFLAGDGIRFSEMVALFIVVFCSVIALWRAPRRSA